MKMNLVGMPPHMKGAGDAFGYSIAFKMARNAILERGWDITEEADLWVHYAPPHFLFPKEGKYNVAFTMWETENFPKDHVESVNKFKAVIVPGRYSREVLKRSGVCKTIYISSLGVDTEFFKYKERRVKSFDEPFRFLWMGAPNVRKGVEDAIRAFTSGFLKSKLNAELYLKSSLFGKEGKLHDWSKDYHAVLDTRTIPKEDLLELFYSADCMVYPSKGEGAGLIPMEFMATGGGVLAAPYSGMKDYIFDTTAIPLKFSLVDANFGCPTKIGSVDLEDLKKKMFWAYENRWYLNYLGRNAHDFICENFSLKVMGDKLNEILIKLERSRML